MKYLLVVLLFLVFHANASEPILNQNSLEESFQNFVCQREKGVSSRFARKKESKIFLLSNPKSGANLISSSLASILKRPVGRAPDKVSEKDSNRIKIDFISEKPFYYKTHRYQLVQRAPAKYEKLILLTRNPKELLFRWFDISCSEDLRKPEIKTFLNNFIGKFLVFENWNSQNRFHVYYEDAITDLNDTLSKLIDFINPSTPVSWDDFLSNQETYLDQIRTNYVSQYGGICGKSSISRPKTIHYTEGKDRELLRSIDKFIKARNPTIWNKYLKRFETP
ncbi:MAG: sulfotransferase domain-containing protein [Simkaniaceae bacterium]